MAKLELSIPYRQLTPVRLWTFGILWAVVGLLASLGIIYGGCLLNCLGPWVMLVKAAAFISIGLLYVYVPYQVITNQAQGIRIILNKDGLGLPPAMGGICLPRWVTWSEVKQLELKQSAGGDRDLVIKLASQEVCKLSLKDLSENDLEQLLLSLEVFATQCVWAPKLIEYRDQVQNSNRGLSGFSYTQLWEEELERRFNSTTFIPLEPEHFLRGGKLKIIRQLAFGGFSAVYIAQTDAGETMVVKESVVSAGQDDPASLKARELFNREALLLAKLDHSQIAKVADHFVEDGRNYLVIEHIAGENLRQLVRRRGKQVAWQVIAWGKQMAAILDYLHGREPPVIHRDFTPDNLIVKDDGTLVLIDFGAANEFLGAATGTLLGKPCYMSPEQVRGKTEPASDIYALGATLYFLLVGRDPEPLHVAHPARDAEAVPNELDLLIAALTALEIKDRPNSARAVLLDLERLSDSGEPAMLSPIENS